MILKFLVGDWKNIGVRIYYASIVYEYKERILTQKKHGCFTLLISFVKKLRKILSE